MRQCGSGSAGGRVQHKQTKNKQPHRGRVRGVDAQRPGWLVAGSGYGRVSLALFDCSVCAPCPHMPHPSAQWGRYVALPALSGLLFTGLKRQAALRGRTDYSYSAFS
jgi:hypothetical protein